MSAPELRTEATMQAAYDWPFTTRSPSYREVCESSLVTMMNAERAAHRVRPLARNAYLDMSAYHHNQVMDAANSFSHQVTGERPLGSRISYTGYTSWRKCGENIACSSDTSLNAVKALQNQMYNEGPGTTERNHYDNIVDPVFTKVGVDIRYDTSCGLMWITIDFAGP